MVENGVVEKGVTERGPIERGVAKEGLTKSGDGGGDERAVEEVAAGGILRRGPHRG